MARAPRKKLEEATTEASLIPIMSCMFLLIPALLLAMEVAPHASVPVNAPRHAATPNPDPDPEPAVRNFAVRISADGFSTARGTPGPDIDIPLLAGASSHDYDTLESKAQQAFAQHPTQFVVSLSAEGDVELATLVRTMDALRGRDCSLDGVIQGEAPGDACYFWDVVIQS